MEGLISGDGRDEIPSPFIANPRSRFPNGRSGGGVEPRQRDASARSQARRSRTTGVTGGAEETSRQHLPGQIAVLLGVGVWDTFLSVLSCFYVRQKHLLF